MKHKNFLVLLFFSFFVFSCAEDNDVTVPRNLQEYIETTSNNDGEVIACAASANGNPNLSYIFYYPQEGATDIRYYEADSLKIVDEKDFSKYRRKSLSIEDVFGGKLQRFSRTSSEENWCLVTYILDGKLHKSNPIRLKNGSKATSWQDNVTIEYTTSLEPKFTWINDEVGDNDIYFQVISEVEDDNFLSGTYTKENSFQYYDTSNVDPNLIINTETPPTLEIDKEYKFTLMDVSADNWVNLVIEENFVPGNLQEYLEKQTVDNSTEIISFAASENGNDNLSYIYYYPLTNARDFRYYETVDVNADKDDFSNYRRKYLTDETAFGVKLRRFSRSDDEDSWCIVTYEIDGKVYKSKPIHLQNKSNPTTYKTDENVDDSQTLKPKFTWEDFGTTNNTQYFLALTDSENTFMSGVFTKEITFQYYNISNTTSNINTETPPDLILEDNYNVTIFGLSDDNWVNLSIKYTFEAK
ncbi:MAG: hypothetical protein AB8B78_01530 [Polaribacter sp.]